MNLEGEFHHVSTLDILLRRWSIEVYVMILLITIIICKMIVNIPRVEHWKNDIEQNVKKQPYLCYIKDTEAPCCLWKLTTIELAFLKDNILPYLPIFLHRKRHGLNSADLTRSDPKRQVCGCKFELYHFFTVADTIIFLYKSCQLCTCNVMYKKHSCKCL